MHNPARTFVASRMIIAVATSLLMKITQKKVAESAERAVDSARNALKYILNINAPEGIPRCR